jgi:hypothetical protein
MVLHGLNRIFQKPTPNLSSSDRTNQLRSKTVYAGTVDLSTTLDKPGNDRYKTYNGPYEIAKKNVYGDATLVASASYKDLLDITKGKVLLNQLPLTDSTYPYYEKNFGNGEMYVGNYQQFDGSKTGPTGCIDSVLVYDLSSTGFTGPGSYTGNSIGYTGPSGMFGSNQDIFIDPTHCYYSDPCASSASYMKFVDVNFKGPTGATGITGPSQYFAQQIINSDQYNGFRFPMSNFTLTCNQQIDSQSEGPLFCPALQPTLSGFSYPPEPYDSPALQITPPQSNSLGAFSYFSSNPSVATISSAPSATMLNSYINTINIVGVGTTIITAIQEPYGIYSSGSISTPFVVEPITFTATWEYTNDGGLSHTDILTNLSLPYDQKTYTIRLKGTAPTATYTQSGTPSALNAGNTAQLTLTGSGNFVGSVTSPSITVTLATFSVITWRYLNNGVFDLLGNLTPVYDNTSYLISAISSIISPSYATYTQSGTASVKNVDDPAAQITLTGSGNFAGSSVTSPSITVTPATFTANWEYSDGGPYTTLSSPGLTPTYDQKTYTIRLAVTNPTNPPYASYTGPTGTPSVTNVADGTAQLTLTSLGSNFTGYVTSPSITVTPATFAVTWRYFDGTSYYDLQNPFTSPYNEKTYTIISLLNPPHASHTQSGTASVTNVADPAAQLTLTGSGNFLGSNHQSPSITVTVATFTVTTWQFTHNNTTSDLTSNLSFPPDGLPYTISFVSSTISPSYATYTPTGNPSQSALNNGDIAQLILAGTGNFVGSDPQSPSISILVENRLTVSNDFVLGSTYSVGYLDSGMAPSLSIQVGGYTYYRFFPTTTTNGTVTPTTIGSVTPTTPFNIRSLVVGGGGSGGMGNSQNYESGDGGNAGTLIDSSGSFTINSSIPLTVGGPGVASSFSTVTANGGATGGIVNISGGNGGSGAGGPGGGGGSGGGGSGGAGGPGVLNNITGGSGVYYAGGGGGCGGHNQHSGGSGGSGGSGVGGQGQSMTSGGAPYSNGANGFGGGGGGTHGPATTVGGSGVVILRFPSYTT